jgi:protein TonB
MPPTLKDGSGLSTSSEKLERAPENAGGSEDSSSAQPVALEVPVTVNGARAVEGSEKREPFSETTSTVLVKANGAVIRLSSSVAPGQLLFLTNEKTRREVVCQVVKSKNYRSVSGYVELEFTEPVLGFWGMRFPGDRHPVAQASSAGAAERKSDVAASSGARLAGNTVEAKPSSYADAGARGESVTTNLADEVEEFKTEIKADSRPTSKADFLAPAESSREAPKPEANRLQEQLSALLLAEQKESEKLAGPVAPASKQELGDAAAKIFEMAKEQPTAPKLELPKSDLSASAKTAPKSAERATKSSFESEEVGIPAWLEPLARNATVHAAAAEENADGAAEQSENWESPAAVEPVAPQKQRVATAKTVPATKYTPAAPMFGNTLLESSAPVKRKAGGSGKGIWIGIAAALIAAAASGAWYFRDSLPLLAPAHSTSQGNMSTISSAATGSNGSAIVNSSSTLPVTATPEPSSVPTNASPPNANTETSAPAAASNLTLGKMQAATITERIPKSSFSKDVTSTPAKSVEIIEPEIKRPSLGTVRLAKPKVGHAANVQANGESEPTPELNNETLSAESSLNSGFADSSKQPAAPAVPVAVGGDVTPARMISSVPPMYPALAKTQHVGGDVRIDALIDASGRVTTMKVISGPSLLHQAAMDALRQWKYHAATLNGSPVPMHLTVTIQFRLQ